MYVCTCVCVRVCGFVFSLCMHVRVRAHVSCKTTSLCIVYRQSSTRMRNEPVIALSLSMLIKSVLDL